MNILEALARLRDDIKIWVTNNLNSLNDSQNAALTALENSLDGKISKAIDEEGFSGNYDDLTNAPIMNDENGNFIIMDEQNNKILEINEDGLYTTNVFSDGVNLKLAIESNKAEQNTKNSELDEKIQDINTNINNLPFQDLNGENFIVTDNKNNKILQVDSNGLRTTKIFFKPEADGDVIDLHEALKQTNTYTDTKAKEVQDDLDEHKAAYVTKVSVLEKADEDLNDAIDDANNRIDNIPLKEDLNNENRFVIVDDKAQNILADFNNDGLRVKNVIINGNNNSTINVKDKFEALDAADNSLQGQLTTLIGEDTNASVRTIAQEETAKIVNNAPEKFDTLKEIADWISNDTTGAAGIASGLLDVRKEVYGTSDGKSKDPSRIDSVEATLAAATGDITTLNNAIGDLTANSVDTRIGNAKTELTSKINDAEARAKKYTDDEVAEHAAEVSAAFGALPFQDLNSEESKSFIVADDDGNKIAEFDKDGLIVTNVKIKDKSDSYFCDVATEKYVDRSFNITKDNPIVFDVDKAKAGEYDMVVPSRYPAGDYAYYRISDKNFSDVMHIDFYGNIPFASPPAVTVEYTEVTKISDGISISADLNPALVVFCNKAGAIYNNDSFPEVGLYVFESNYSQESNVYVQYAMSITPYIEKIKEEYIPTVLPEVKLSVDPTDDMHPTTKGYVDLKIDDIKIEDVVYYGQSSENGGELPSEIALEDLMPKAGGKFTGAVEYTTFTGGNITSSGIITADKVYGAVWNDYAEFRQATEDIEPGRVVCENGDDTVSLSTKRMQPGAMMVSDTYGFAIGETDKCKCPIAVAGRVLMYPYEKREKYKPGDAVCSGPNGTVSKMSRLETILFPDRILGTVSSIPNYEFWGEKNIEVKNRIWIKGGI